MWLMNSSKLQVYFFIIYFIKNAYLGVHFLLLWAAESFHDIGVGGLEAEASDEIADLVVVELALAGSIVELETVLELFRN